MTICKQIVPNDGGSTTGGTSPRYSGYVLFCALELVISRPPMVPALFPLMILFGLCYIIFAWALYLRIGLAVCQPGIYVYFFLDPTFTAAPVAYALLLAATWRHCQSITTWITGHLASTAYPAVSSCAVLLAALATCTWRKRPS
eukprot:Skav235335  [mRNA]  locus=scaffold520:735007:736734:- [translate_table: standard]